MNLEEFRKKAEEQEDWAPGWDALDEAFNTLYKDQEPRHYPTINKAALGGQEYLDGYSIFTSSKGHQHFLTYGFSELYADEDSLGGEYSFCGFELTAKWKDEEKLNATMGAIFMCCAGDLGRHTFKNKAFYEHGHLISLDFTLYLERIESPFKKSDKVALLVVNDTELEPINTIYGEVEFLQLFGITQEEKDYIIENRDKVEDFIAEKKKDNPLLLTSLNE